MDNTRPANHSGSCVSKVVPTILLNKKSVAPTATRLLYHPFRIYSGVFRYLLTSPRTSANTPVVTGDSSRSSRLANTHETIKATTAIPRRQRNDLIRFMIADSVFILCELVFVMTTVKLELYQVVTAYPFLQSSSEVMGLALSIQHDPSL